MEAKDLVGKLVTSNYLESRKNLPPGVEFKVVGYVLDTDLVIVDAKRLGWQGLDMYDRVTEKCKTYWYLRLCEITEVL